MATRDIYDTAFDEDVQADETTECPECDGRVTTNTAETVCEDCGLIIADQSIDRGPQWRSNDPDEQKRTGDPLTVARHDRGLSTVIGHRKDSSGNELASEKRRRLARMRREQSRGRWQSKAERNLGIGLTEIRRIASALGLAVSVRNQACQLFRTAQTDGLPINELFYSLQGEGKLTGMPSVFIRTSGCNLRCWFCDSYHTSWEPTHATMDLDAIIEEVQSYEDAEHVVLTGGEPLIHDDAVTLLERLDELGYHTTVETNGTIHRDVPIDLASISPKLASSTPTAEKDPKGDGEWEERHEERRVDYDALASLVDDYDSQLKFVVTGPDDLPEIEELLEKLRDVASSEILDSDVLLMPEGMTRDELDRRRGEVANLAMEYGYRYTTRLHVDLWNDAPGT